MGSQIYCLLIMIGKCSIIFIIETNVCIMLIIIPLSMEFMPVVFALLLLEIMFTLKFVFVKGVIVHTLENHIVLPCLQ